MNKFFYSFATLSVATSLCLASTTIDKTDALVYLNSLRTSAGLSSLVQSNILETAAQNHINYLVDTDLTGHYEDNSTYPSNFYTGDIPHDRGVYAGYKASYYLENFSSGQKDFKASIDGLMSAIYHRYGFLNLNIDEIGIGVKNKLYNYNMGNSLLNNLCNGESYSGNEQYSYKVCSDENFRIESTLYNKTLTSLIEKTPDIVIWPPLDAVNIPPVFYEESPDPLPNQSVSGYPISLEFNSDRFKEKTIIVDSFDIYNENNRQLTDTFLMKQSNDINKEHTQYQFTLFPLKRLDWNSVYKVKVNYSVDNEIYTKEWSFRTQNIPYVLYNIEGSENEEFTLKSGVTYAFYFKPIDGNDTFNATSFSYNTVKKPEVSLYDSNTLLVTLSGQDDEYCNVKLKKDGIITKTVSLKLGENSMQPVADKEFDFVEKPENSSYITDSGSIFETNIENSVYENTTLTTATITTSDKKDVFVRLVEDENGDTLVSLNVDDIKSNLPKFSSPSKFDVEKLNGKVIVTIKTKLTKPMLFEGI